MRAILNWYLHHLAHNPIATKCLSSTVIVGSGDALTQLIEMNNKNSAQPQSQQRFNFQRCLKMASYGTILGPTLHIWYKFLMRTSDKFVSPNRPLRQAVVQTVIDQTTWAPVSILLFYSYMNVLEGKSPNELKQKLRDQFLDTLKMNYYIWPAVQVFNFCFVPLMYRVLFVNCVALFWNAYLSFTQYDTDNKDHDTAHEQQKQ